MAKNFFADTLDEIADLTAKATGKDKHEVTGAWGVTFVEAKTWARSVDRDITDMRQGKPSQETEWKRKLENFKDTLEKLKFKMLGLYGKLSSGVKSLFEKIDRGLDGLIDKLSKRQSKTSSSERRTSKSNKLGERLAKGSSRASGNEKPKFKGSAIRTGRPHSPRGMGW